MDANTLKVPKKTQRSVTELISRCRQARNSANGLQAIATAIDYSYTWVSKFTNGHVPDPTVGTAQALNDYFDAMDSAAAAAGPAPTKKSAGSTK